MSEGDLTKVSVDAKNWTAALESTSMNTLLTMLCTIGIAVLVWQSIAHAMDAREANAAFVAAIKDQTAAMRDQTKATKEQSCLLRYSGNPAEKAEFCKSVTQ